MTKRVLSESDIAYSGTCSPCFYTDSIPSGCSERVDFVFEHPDGRRQRIRKVSLVQTQRGAEEFERELRQALLDGSRKERKEAPRFAAFAEEFLEDRDARHRSLQGEEARLGAQGEVVNNHLTMLRKALSVAIDWELHPLVPEVRWMKGPQRCVPPEIKLTSRGSHLRAAANLMGAASRQAGCPRSNSVGRHHPR
jgi:hypothetical protein